jgi:sulfur relay (sulfurtransferase) DsrF/TusC family protein
LIAAKVAVFVVEEDIRERGLPTDRFVAGIETLNRAGIPEVIERFDHVWRW